MQRLRYRNDGGLLTVIGMDGRRSVHKESKRR